MVLLRDICRKVHLLVSQIQVEGGASIVHRGVLASLDGEAKVLGGQVAQRARLGPAPGGRRAHQRRKSGRVSDLLPGMAQQQRLHWTHVIMRLNYKGMPSSHN